MNHSQQRIEPREREVPVDKPLLMDLYRQMLGIRRMEEASVPEGDVTKPEATEYAV